MVGGSTVTSTCCSLSFSFIGGASVFEFLQPLLYISWATVGHLLTLGVGHLQFYRSPGTGNLHIPGRPLGIWHTCFRKYHGWVHRERRGICQLVRQGLEKLVDVLKVCFLNFRYFFITCKHINISDKVNYILFITKQSLTWTWLFCISHSKLA